MLKSTYGEHVLTKDGPKLAQSECDCQLQLDNAFKEGCKVLEGKWARREEKVAAEGTVGGESEI